MHLQRTIHRGAALWKAMPHWVKGLVLLFSTWGTYFAVLWPRMFSMNNGDVRGGWIAMLFDWGVHVAYASVFAYRAPADWLLSHPYLLGHKFNYSFLADAISGLLMRAGMDLIPAFVVPSILTSLILLAVLFFFYDGYFSSIRKNFLATSAFLLGGGVGFYVVIQDIFRNPSWSTLLFPPHEATHSDEHYIRWMNTVTDQFVPQRALLLAFVLMTGILILLRRWEKKGFRGIGLKEKILFGLLVLLLVPSSIHSCMALAMILVVFFLCNLRQWKFFLTLGVPLAIVVLPFTITMYYVPSIGGMLQWYPGWLARQQGINVVRFWLLNWGILIPLAALGMWRMKLYKDSLVIAGMVIFITCNLVIFQPDPWDNHKLFLYSYLIFMVPAVAYLGRLWQTKKKLIAVLAAIILMLSGAIDIVRVLSTDKLSNVMWSRETLELAAQFRAISSPTDVVLTNDSHHNWVLTLTGRVILKGTDKWVIDAWAFPKEGTWNDYYTLKAGQPGSEDLLQKYHIRFVAVEDGEKWPILQRVPMKLVLQKGGKRVYEVIL